MCESHVPDVVGSSAQQALCVQKSFRSTPVNAENYVQKQHSEDGHWKQPHPKRNRETRCISLISDSLFPFFSHNSKAHTKQTRAHARVRLPANMSWLLGCSACFQRATKSVAYRYPVLSLPRVFFFRLLRRVSYTELPSDKKL